MTSVMLAVVAAIAVPAAADVVKAVVDPYLKAQTALADDELADAKAAGSTLAAEAAKLGTAGEGLVTAARKLQSAGDLEAAREAFYALTGALLKYAEASGTTLGDDVKVAWCPMNNRSWAQKNGEIANPYFGKAMRSCGEFKKSEVKD
jgi:hypothetical protein